MLPDGLVQGGFLRGFAESPRRCFPLGSSEAATHGSSPLFLRAAAPVRGCSRRISPSISAPLCLPRSPLLCARPFRAGFFGSAPPCSPPPRAVSGPVPARADASRRSFAFPLARRAPFLPCAPCTPGLCASRRGGESCKASCCALLHARPCSCAGGRIALFFRLFPRTPGLCARRAHPGHPCRRAHPGRPCRRAPPFASVRIPPCRRAPFFSISRQESEHKRRILYEHMFV